MLLQQCEYFESIIEKGQYNRFKMDLFSFLYLTWPILQTLFKSKDRHSTFCRVHLLNFQQKCKFPTLSVCLFICLSTYTSTRAFVNLFSFLVCLSIFLCFSLSVYLSLYLYVSLSFCFSVWVGYVWLTVSLSVSLHLCLFVCVCVYVPLSICLYPSLSLSFCQFVYLSVRPFLFVRPFQCFNSLFELAVSVRISLCLSHCLSICLPVCCLLLYVCK